MKKTILVISHNRPIQDGTREALAVLTRAGAPLVTQRGCADVALARCMALSAACDTIRNLNTQVKESWQNFHSHTHGLGCGENQTACPERPTRTEFDVVLMIDDDMLFTLEQAAELVTHARETGVPASAMYATTEGRLAAGKLPGMERWYTGLGLLAIPAALLLKLEADSPSFPLKNGVFTAFTSSSCHDGKWFSEDFELCRRLGGVHLLPMAVGHLKTIPIYPDETTVALVRAGKPLPESLTAAELDAIEPRRIARDAEGGR